MNKTHLLYSARHAFIAASLIVMLGVSTFFAFEPSVSRSATASDDFLVTQSIGSEISFLTPTADVAMIGTISGITGGLSSGTTTVRVLTNDSAGYSMYLKFASTTVNPGVAMSGDTQGGAIANYTPGAGVPEYGFTVGANTAEFGYTVWASTTGDLPATFRNNASSCGAGGGDTPFNCWMSPSTTPSGNGELIVYRNTETTNSGATTSIAFRVQVTSSPSPAVPEDTYTATATLTAITN